MTIPLCVELGAGGVSSISPQREREIMGDGLMAEKMGFFAANTINSNLLCGAECAVPVSTGI